MLVRLSQLRPVGRGLLLWRPSASPALVPLRISTLDTITRWGQRFPFPPRISFRIALTRAIVKTTGVFPSAVPAGKKRYTVSRIPFQRPLPGTLYN